MEGDYCIEVVMYDCKTVRREDHKNLKFILLIANNSLSITGPLQIAERRLSISPPLRHVKTMILLCNEIEKTRNKIQ